MSEVQNWGSQQWRLMRIALHNGATLEEAAAAGSMDVVEARYLAEIDDKRGPLPPEAFTLIPTHGAPRVAPTTTQEKEASMAKEDDGGAAEYKRPNAELAFKIYDQVIKPKETHLATIKGDMSEPYQQIKDNANFPRKVLNFIIALESEEDAKRDHLLLALADGLKHRQLYLPRDLVTMANGEDGDDIVPTGERDDDALLVDEDEGDDDGFDAADSNVLPFSEASEPAEDAPKRRGRPRKVTPPADEHVDEPAYGTGDAARAAMSAAAAETYAALN